MPLLVLALWSSAALSATVERGVDAAVAVHLTPGGLGRLGDAIERVVPATFPVEGTVDTFTCDEEDAAPLDYVLSPLDLLLSADEVAVTTSEDAVHVTVYATLGSTAATLDVTGDCAFLEDLDETCQLQIPTIPVEIHLEVALRALGDGIDAIAEPVVVTLAPIPNPVDDCTLSSFVGTLIGQEGNEHLIDELLLAQVQPSLAELPARVEEALEGALDDLAFDTTLDLPGAPLDLSLYPTRIDVDDNGILIGLGATALTQTTGCVDPSQVPLPVAEWPAFGPTAEGTSLEYDAGVFLGRGFIEELMVALWGSGVFCTEVVELADVPVQGAFVAAFFGDETGTLLGPTTPAKLVLANPTPPDTWFWEDQPVLTFTMDDLTMDLVSEVDFRETRVLQVGIQADLGIDLGVVDGVLAPTLVIEQSAFLFSERYSELVSPGYAANLGELVATVLATVLPDDELATVALPEPLGARLGGIVWRPTPDDQWQGGYALIDVTDVQPLPVAGCSASSFSCDGEGEGIDVGEALGCNDPEAMGCAGEGSSCTTLPAAPFVPLLPAILLVLRRRRR